VIPRTALHSIERRLLALRRRSSKSSPARDWRAIVRRAITELEELNRSTERDFLGVGEKLMEFRSAARQIASAMAAMTELISGEQGRNASHALTRMLEHCQEMGAQIERSGQALGRIRELSRSIRLAFSGLPHTVSVFRTLCTLTRIETARLGGTGAGLGHLTAEVGPLSESIQTSGEGILEASDGLDHKVQSAMRRGAELQAAQLQELPALIAGVMDGIKSFEERRNWAVESSGRQAAEYAAVCGSIDDLVESIQFHDITRQQIEHVIEALERLGADDQSDGESAGSSSIILTLQARHLSEAASIFATSMERMERDLCGIAERIESAPEASRALLGVSRDDISEKPVGKQGDSFFLKMEGQFSAILSMLGTCTTARGEMEATAASLEETIGEMRASIAEIRGIEIRIQRISTNASVRATHIGAPGVALNVIAEVMQRLALDSNTKTEDVAGTLDAMNQASSRVSGRSLGAVPGDAVPGGAAPGAHADTNQVVDEMRRSVGELHRSSECSFSRANEIMALGTRLAGDIGAIRSGFSARAVFAETVDRVRGELEEIGAQAAPEGSGVDRGQALEDYAKTYTMQRERDIHHAVVAGAALPAPSTEAPKGISDDGDLGDNIELF
jgi:hypothetical protein